MAIVDNWERIPHNPPEPERVIIDAWAWNQDSGGTTPANNVNENTAPFNPSTSWTDNVLSEDSDSVEQWTGNTFAIGDTSQIEVNVPWNRAQSRKAVENSVRVENALLSELSALDGMMGQNPETGASLRGESMLGNYTNRLLGSPFQLLDSVDRRFPSVNKYVGTEFLRHFILHAPILHMRPGLPRYTGGTNSFAFMQSMKNIYRDATSGNLTPGQSIALSLAGGTIFGAGSRMQRRMFGFREMYLDYMQYVNYMCRSISILLGLEDDPNIPNGTFVTSSDGTNQFEAFSTLRWENYRMINSPSNFVERSAGQFGRMVGAFFGRDTTIYDTIEDKVKSVLFHVEPVAFTETLSNMTDKSLIESSIDGITNSVGSEIAFITGSGADTGVIGSLTNFLGSSIESAATTLNGFVEPITGGFMSNLFSGAVGSMKGQKMIYPDIYKSSQSTMDYEFSCTLASPYGDIYNYYMNVVVPLCHLIALTAPRMVTANTTASPFLVQAYIPGMCTCNLGIVSNMVITKNPNAKHVSVHGFPLTIKVVFTVKELYNAMAISPANDPSSFLHNETLNDYMANMAGLIPSMDTFTQKREAMFENMSNYFTNREWFQDFFARPTEWIENIFTPGNN